MGQEDLYLLRPCLLHEAWDKAESEQTAWSSPAGWAQGPGEPHLFYSCGGAGLGWPSLSSVLRGKMESRTQ